jgi:hypothetical protein
METKPTRPAGLPPSMRAPQPHTVRTHAAPPPPRPANHPAPPNPPKKHKTGMLIGLIALVAIAIVMVGAAIMMMVRGYSTSTAIKSNEFQAVFLTNNMVYFGKLSDTNGEYVKMTNIFYLQVQGQQSAQTQAQSSTTQPQLSLTKLGGELHGPEDTMYINKKEILFWENLKSDGKVTQAINNYQGK